MVLILALKPVSKFERRMLDSRNYVSLRLIILLRVLQVQLVKLMVYSLVWFVGSFLLFEDKDGYGLLLYGRDVTRDPDIVVYI